MNALAFIVGVADYHNTSVNLPNAINDAHAIAQKLSDLGFIVDKAINCNQQGFMQGLSSFGQKLKKFDVGLFYFAGHGLEIDNMNFLTTVDTSFIDSETAKYTSIKLDLVIGQIEKADPKIKIIILDACRNNPLKTIGRGIHTGGLAPIYAPKGTLIAFSTSPGQTASENGPGGNSIYTASLLKHLDVAGITIEEFFKRVRTSVFSLSKGKQTSWEHTSLIGTFGFNEGVLMHAVEMPYPNEYIADKDFKGDGLNFTEIIQAMKSYNYREQGQALQRFKGISKEMLVPEFSFLMGRNILQVAESGEFRTNDFMNNLQYWLTDFNTDGTNHLLNGMLYEMYFNSSGRFRNGDFKSKYLDQLYQLQEEKEFKSSFKLLHAQLNPFKHSIFYLPFNKSIAIEASFDKSQITTSNKKKMDRYILVSVKHEDVELMENDQINHNWGSLQTTHFELSKTISQILMIPEDKLTLSCSHSEKEADSIYIPDRLNLSRVLNSKE